MPSIGHQYGLYIPKAKNYLLVPPNGHTIVKGLYRKRDRYPLERKFPIAFLQRYFGESPESAEAYYQQLRTAIQDLSIGVEQLRVTRKIATNEKRLVELGIGVVGEIVSFQYTEEQWFNQKSGKVLKSHALSTKSDPYWVDYYLEKLDEQYQDIVSQSLPSEDESQSQLLAS